MRVTLRRVARVRVLRRADNLEITHLKRARAKCWNLKRQRQRTNLPANVRNALALQRNLNGTLVIRAALQLFQLPNDLLLRGVVHDVLRTRRDMLWQTSSRPEGTQIGRASCRERVS